jgi:hypothetical protein
VPLRGFGCFANQKKSASFLSKQTPAVEPFFVQSCFIDLSGCPNQQPRYNTAQVINSSSFESNYGSRTFSSIYNGLFLTSVALLYLIIRHACRHFAYAGGFTVITRCHRNQNGTVFHLFPRV